MDGWLITADEKLYNALHETPLGARILWVEGDLGVPTAAIAEDFEIDLDALSRYSADEIQLLFSYHTGDRLTDADLTALSGLAAHLQELYLSNPAVTDAGMVNLRGLLNLAMLDLRGTSVTDAGLEHIGGLVGLRTLNLAETAVTDAGLAHPARALWPAQAGPLGNPGDRRRTSPRIQ